MLLLLCGMLSHPLLLLRRNGRLPRRMDRLLANRAWSMPGTTVLPHEGAIARRHKKLLSSRVHLLVVLLLLLLMLMRGRRRWRWRRWDGRRRRRLWTIVLLMQLARMVRMVSGHPDGVRVVLLLVRVREWHHRVVLLRVMVE